MSNWQDNTEILSKLFTSGRVGIISDMDGTLAPIVPFPTDAKPTERNRELLQTLSQQVLLVAVVSGRSVEDLIQRVNLPNLVYAGNHGLERWENNQVDLHPVAKIYRPNLEQAIQAINAIKPDGVWIEDKQVTLSVHYRDADAPEETANTLAPQISEIADEHDLKMFQGRMIFELRPPLNVDKGTIFKDLVAEHALNAAIYIGDDTTDADALKMAQELREKKVCYSVAVGVASDETPKVVEASSDVMVSGVEGVEELLAWLSSMATKASST